jgi:ribosomal protein S27E
MIVVILVVLLLIGIFIAVYAMSTKPSAPAGMVPVRCVRCNAVQTVPSSQVSFACWQCGSTVTVPPIVRGHS